MFNLLPGSLTHYAADDLNEGMMAVRRDLALQGYRKVWLSIEGAYFEDFKDLAIKRGWTLNVNDLYDEHGVAIAGQGPSADEVRIKIRTIDNDICRLGFRLVRHLICQEDELVILVSASILPRSRLWQEPDNYITVKDNVVTYEKTRYQIVDPKTISLEGIERIGTPLKTIQLQGNGNVETI